MSEVVAFGDPEQRKELLELHKSLLQTWQFEVNSHWQRSAYFAAFEKAASSGTRPLSIRIMGGPYFCGYPTLTSVLYVF